mmetsp:Transcript_20988/g.31655  ORF Transcript_20988/g.31655 Transcript_20988/m.31655 type:complete len:90 (-) Transcript_20988:110-379(-)
MPSMLGFNIERNLQPTLDFYIQTYGDKDSAITNLQANPRFLAASLEKRLKPRRNEAKKAGISINASCVRRIATDTNEKWNIFIALNKCE